LDNHIKTVLVVDDEPALLRLVQEMLRPRAIKVLVAPRPSEALRICETQAIDLLISDVRMPEIDGNKLAERILKLYPDASVLLMSGYAKEAPSLGKPGQVRFLRKPFFPSELIKQLQELLPEA
jgi:CheY-like chemotaxis protein